MEEVAVTVTPSSKAIRPVSHRDDFSLEPVTLEEGRLHGMMSLSGQQVFLWGFRRNPRRGAGGVKDTRVKGARSV